MFYFQFSQFSQFQLAEINLSPHPTMSHYSVTTVVVIYGLCFLIAAVGNLTVLITLLRSKHRRSRFSNVILHLSIADLIVAFLMIPVEVSHKISYNQTDKKFYFKIRQNFSKLMLKISLNLKRIEGCFSN